MDIPNFNDMIATLGMSMPDLMRLVTAISYVLGFVLIGHSLYTFKQYGDMRTMQSSANDFRGPAVMLTMGTLLIYFPSTVDMSVATFWGEGSTVMNYQPDDSTGETESVMLTTILRIVQVVGAISFVRGLALLSKVGNKSGGQPGQFSRGISHCIAGILGINIYMSWQMLLATFGIYLD